MNYLAHFFLSNRNEGLIVGNYIADDVKGNGYLRYPENIKKGILLHRKIDEYTDNHHYVLKSKNLIRTDQKKYTPVVVDIFYDYFLANDWEKYSNHQSLHPFTKFIYHILYKNIGYLPLKSKIRLPFMANSNWLLNYKNIEGIQKATTGLSKRTPYANNMATAYITLQKNEDSLKRDFNNFFPELNNFVSQELENMK